LEDLAASIFRGEMNGTERKGILIDPFLMNCLTNHSLLGGPV